MPYANPADKRASNARYRDRHRVEIRARERKRYRANLEAQRARSRDKYRRFAAKHTASVMAWRERNAERWRLYRNAWARQWRAKQKGLSNG